MRTALIRTTLIALMLVFATAPGQAAAPAPADASSLSDGQLDQRIQFLEERLDDSKRHGQIWFWSWLTINGGSMVGNGVGAALTSDHDDTVQRSTSAALGAIGVANLFLRPLEARYGADPIRGLPEATREDKLAKLRAGEDQLRRNAERAEERWSLIPHAANVGLSTAAGLVVGLWGETGAGIQIGVSTLIGGTANLLTQPWGPEQDWKDYLAMAGQRNAGVDVDLVVTSLEDGGRVGLRFSW